MQQAEATSGFLRLAQEYETAFGREALERLIADAVPDLRFEPGDLHQRLLALPWSDVFTTNWDTLLERATTHVIDRHYDVVRTIAEIPGSARPRIVKLHGTLPATRPLIFTEEDFRTYPSRFAPFVNLAQQSIMENVFCLLGFSGDDPNFLYWSGWVRDHLKEYAPRIYLVGWLDLPPPRRRMLEDRGVVPIDLARLPIQGDLWPEETRRQRAIEWFLSSLEAAEPPNEVNWPSTVRRYARPLPAYLPAVLFDDSSFPQEESAGPEHPANLDKLRNTVRIWCHNRELYPGWIVAPKPARLRLWWNTERWISTILEFLPTLSSAERIEVLEELNWRLETCLVPLTPGLVAAISGALSEVNALTLSDLRVRWVRLAVASLRAAREADDAEAFQRWSGTLAPHLLDYAWLGPRIAYERCLLSLARLDHAAVERALDDLDTSVEVFWKVRKAGILAELGKTEESFRLAREALPEIRQQLGHGAKDIPTLSREGWAMVLASGFSFYPPPRETEWEMNNSPTGPRGVEPHERSERRWDVLQRYGCDARDDLDETQRALENKPPKSKPAVEEKLGFDLWYRTRTARGEQWSSRGKGWEHLPALQAKRLVEETGIPPIVDNVDLAKTLLSRAVAWLAKPSPDLALGLILRVTSYEKDEIFDQFFNRSLISQIANSQIETLVERVERAIAYGVPRASAAITEENHDRSIYWVSRLRVTVEVLSRLVLRLDEARANQVLDRALGFYHLPLFRQHHWLTEPLAHLFSRTVSALDFDFLRTRLAQFLALPLPGEGNFKTDDPRDWPDPFRLAARRFVVAPHELTATPEWHQVVERLIAAVAGTPLLFPRKPALDRLEILLRWELLSEEQKARLGEALWRHQLPVPGGGLPEGTELLACTFLALPSPDPGLVERLFRQSVLVGTQANKGSLYPATSLQNLVGFSEIQRQGKTSVVLSPVDIDQILEHILADWRSGRLRRLIESLPPIRYFDREFHMQAFTLALGRVILPSLEPTSPQISEVLEMLADLKALNFPVEVTYPALARLRPDLMPDLSDRLRQSLASSRKEQAEDAIKTVWWWLQERHQLSLQEPPSDIVREIAIAVSMRRPSLQEALRAAEWIMRNDAAVESDRFARLVAEGLGYLLSEARYDVELVRQPTSTLRPTEIAEVRLLSVKMALALESAGFGELPSVGEWIREGQNDPFPEVRHILAESGVL